MSRRYYRNYYYYRSFNNVSKIKELSQTLAGIDKDIIRKLFTLPYTKLEEVFSLYERKYGLGSVKYARNVFREWKSGEKKMTGPTAEKFVDLVPRFLTNQERYDLIRKIYDAKRSYEHFTVEFIIDHNIYESKSKLETIFEELCKKPFMHTLDQNVINKINWICDKDSLQARKIIAAIESEHSLLIVKAARKDIDQLFSSIQQLGDSALGKHSIKLPYGTIDVIVRKPTIWENIKRNFK